MTAQEQASDPFCLEQRVERLVERILARQCVPFLGAGISGVATETVPEAEREDLPPLGAKEMAQALAKELHEQLSARDAGTEKARALRDFGLGLARRTEDGSNILDVNSYLDREEIPRTRRELSTCDSPDLFAASDEVPPLGEVAELCWSLLGPYKTCEVLRMSEWGRFQPTAAHHYLAILVREGLIREVLETNYDCFVEQAVKQTYGPGGSERDGTHPGPAPVIHDIESYRKHLALARDDRRHEALVKVIKLNGCAKFYVQKFAEESPSESSEKAEERRNDIAQTIGLTEEQLQGWGNRRWGRDLLRERVRSRCLLFIGFAGEDPLVRHHVVDVLREFVDAGETRRQPDRPWWQLRNAPVIVAFGDNFSFAQHQMLRTFRDAHSARSGTSRDGSDVYAGAFLGRDGPAIRQEIRGEPGEPDMEKHLPADDFMQLVAASVVGKLICDEYLGRGSPVQGYLRGALRFPDVLLASLAYVITDPREAGEPSLFGEWLALGNPTKPGQESSAWSTACFALRSLDPGRAGYRPFLTSGVKHPMLLVMLGLAAHLDEGHIPSAGQLAEMCRSRWTPNAGSAGTRQRTPAFRLVAPDPARGRRAVYLAADVDAVVFGESPLLQDAVVIALGRGSTSPFRRQYQVDVPRNDGSSVQELAVREVYIVGDLVALRGGRSRPVEQHEAVRHLHSLATNPETLLRQREGWRDFCTEYT